MKRFPYFIASVALFFGAMGVMMAQQTTVTESTEKTVKEEVVNNRRVEVGSFRANWFIGMMMMRNHCMKQYYHAG